MEVIKLDDVIKELNKSNRSKGYLLDIFSIKKPLTLDNKFKNQKFSPIERKWLEKKHYLVYPMIHTSNIDCSVESFESATKLSRKKLDWAYLNTSKGSRIHIDKDHFYKKLKNKNFSKIELITLFNKGFLNEIER